MGASERGDMGTIFVAYGDHDERERVLAFAAERAAASGDDLFVYHVEEAEDESPTAVREEVARVIEQTAPGVSVETHVDVPSNHTDASNVSKQKRLLDAVLKQQLELLDVSDVFGVIVDPRPSRRLVCPALVKAEVEHHRPADVCSRFRIRQQDALVFPVDRYLVGLEIEMKPIDEAFRNRFRENPQSFEFRPKRV